MCAGTCRTNHSTCVRLDIALLVSLIPRGGAGVDGVAAGARRCPDLIPADHTDLWSANESISAYTYLDNDIIDRI